MKTFKFAALTLLLAGFAVCANACGDDKGNKDNDKATESKVAAPTDTTLATGEGFAPTVNIRFVDMNRILSEYKYAVQESEKIQKLGSELQQYQNSLGAQLQKKQNDIQQKMNNNGYMTQQSYEADMKDLAQLQQSSEQQFAARAQKVDAEAQKTQAAIYAAINNFIVKYNEDKKYDAILYKDSGIYFNPSLDITDDVIAGLNAETTQEAPAEK